VFFCFSFVRLFIAFVLYFVFLVQTVMKKPMFYKLACAFLFLSEERAAETML